MKSDHINRYHFKKIYLFTLPLKHGKLKCTVHCKKRLVVFRSPAGMSLTKLSLAGKNFIISGQGDWLVTSRLGTGKSLIFFTVHIYGLSDLLVESLVEVPLPLHIIESLVQLVHLEFLNNFYSVKEETTT
jgi:hypothetical protein